MLRFQEKHSYKRYLYTLPVFIVLAVLLAFAGRATWGVFQKQVETLQNVREARAKLEELKEQEQFLRSEIARLSTAQGVEAEIREKFPVVKEGEEMMVVVDTDDPAIAETASTSQTASTFFGKVRSFFGWGRN